MAYIWHVSWTAGSAYYEPGMFSPSLVLPPSITIFSVNNQAFASRLAKLAEDEDWCSSTRVLRGPGEREKYNITLTLKPEYNERPANLLISESTQPGGPWSVKLWEISDKEWDTPESVIEKISGYVVTSYNPANVLR